MLIQQGDVLIESALIPSGAKAKTSSKRGLVLAEGESTGHAHTITSTEDAVLFENGDDLYLRVLRETKLTHEEHGVVTIPAGEYTVRKVREYDHFAEEAKPVQD